jgi:hypothetical protein
MELSGLETNIVVIFSIATTAILFIAGILAVCFRKKERDQSASIDAVLALIKENRENRENPKSRMAKEHGGHYGSLNHGPYPNQPVGWTGVQGHVAKLHSAAELYSSQVSPLMKPSSEDKMFERCEAFMQTLEDNITKEKEEECNETIDIKSQWWHSKTILAGASGDITFFRQLDSNVRISNMEAAGQIHSIEPLFINRVIIRFLSTDCSEDINLFLDVAMLRFHIEGDDSYKFVRPTELRDNEAIYEFGDIPMESGQAFNVTIHLSTSIKTKNDLNPTIVVETTKEKDFSPIPQAKYYPGSVASGIPDFMR